MFKQTIKQLESMILLHNAEVARLTKNIFKEYKRKWWWIPRKIIWLDRSWIYDWIIMIERKDDFWEWFCRLETFIKNYEVA